MKNVLYSLCLLLLIVSCGQEPKKTTSIKPIKKLTGKVFNFGPEWNEQSCEADGGCDCCYGDAVFINDSEGVYIGYCLEQTVYQGFHYTLSSTGVKMKFKSFFVNNEAIYEEDIEDTTKYTSRDTTYIEKSRMKPERLTFISCGNKTGMKGLDGFGFEEKGAFTSRMKDLRERKVLELLDAVKY